MATITDVRKGDIYTLGGSQWIALSGARRWGRTGDTHRRIIVERIDLDLAGLRADGVYELGSCGIETTDIPDDTPVDITDRGVAYHHHIDDTDAEDNEACRARDELVRMTAVRRRQEREYTEADGRFRTRIRAALKAGMSVAEVRAETGLSRERVYQIRDGRR